MNLKPIFFINKDEAPKDAVFIDALPGALEEAKRNFFEVSQQEKGICVYYPWRNMNIHIPSEALYFKLRTSRNRNIIAEEEQKRYRNAAIGIAGLSVGSAVYSALVATGGPKIIKLADFDVIEITNLNRMRACLPDIGANKIEVAARNIWELDPFSELYLYENGVTRENIEKFILGGAGEPKLDIFIDEMDSLDLKAISRIIARQNKIPVLMATDNGDSIILDIERYDLEPDRPIFHGLLGNIQTDDLKNLDKKEWLKLATKIVDPNYLTERMQYSLLEIGRTTGGVPQLGSTASLAGAAIAYVVRRIANGQDAPSGRYTLSLEEKFIPDYTSLENIEKRKKKTEEFIAKFEQK